VIKPENKHSSYFIDGQRFEAVGIEPGLYLVPTPIGNLADITLRALRLLAAADVIYCEDTRVTRKLTSHFSIKTQLKTYNDYADENRRKEIIERIKQGQTIALASDAGMPLVSDPGVKLVRDVVKAGLPVIALPGPSATLTALAASGLASERFLFAGFVPSKSGQRQSFFEELATQQATLILFETARRILASLQAMQSFYGGREIAIARELTKHYEEIIRGDLSAVIENISARDRLKGEIVLIISPAAQKQTTLEDISEPLLGLLKTHSVKDASEILAKSSGLPRREIYALALEQSKSDKNNP
jgi:16S rRNA (cytidine1402-2'-O)-methyltransferase